MKRSWFSILLVLVLFGLLGLLATLQYRWVGQISSAERDRLQKRLQTDTERFADDFNNEIRKVYFNFQIDADAWREKGGPEFNQRLAYWKEKSAYPALPSDFYFIGANGERLAYDPSTETFGAANLPDEISKLADSMSGETIEPVVENIPALILPIYESPERVSSTALGRPVRIAIDQPRKRYGFLVVKLDKNVIEQEIFPALTREYFSDDNGANYRLSVVGKNDSSRVIFKNHPDEASTASDSSAQLFQLSPDKMTFFFGPDMVGALKRTPAPGIEKGGVEKEKVRTGNFVFSQRFETRTESSSDKPADKSGPETEKTKTLDLKVTRDDEKPRITMMESKNPDDEGAWVLNVQHRDGSLDQFVANARNRNLAVSFGILALLGISIGLVFLSAQRAKTLAQRQLDFVSSVSHEFRTPLAVLYSAGENLTDGVVHSRQQVSEYGTLIKHEGKKLSGMVEQILEFAGARSGKRKYDLRKTNIADVLSDALTECQPLINESGFTVEKNIQPDLPDIAAEAAALSHAFQNLINNAIKYSRDEKYLKITAENGGGAIKLSFEDRGRGIAARERSQIFEPFYRGKEVVEAQIHGNGLGLSLVKQIVEAHNGRVEVESRPGEGSKFTIKLPVQQ
ncbi:MAG TPA: HAMP domain-containing sensor histidine kinase [Pyrinomonadaceae bacterium]|nr:HAMP domain-containing sensor histidine kinase [Pyrinomonadaceae bacterium]